MEDSININIGVSIHDNDKTDDDINKNLQKIIQYSGIDNDYVKIYDLHDKKINKCQNQNYIKDIIVQLQK